VRVAWYCEDDRYGYPRAPALRGVGLVERAGEVLDSRRKPATENVLVQSWWGRWRVRSALVHRDYLIVRCDDGVVREVPAERCTMVELGR
jgi:hypothetical protein